MLRIYINEFLRFVYWGPLRLVVQMLPPRAGYRIARGASKVLEALQRDKRRRLQRGIEFLGLPDPKALVSKTFENYSMNSIEVFYYPRLSKSLIGRMVDYEGVERLVEALEKGSGAILMHGHFGNEELLMPAIGLLGVRSNQLASRLGPERLKGPAGVIPNFVKGYAYRKRIGYREKLPVNFIYLDGPLKEIYARLKRNEVLLLAIDGREGTKWVEADFLGKKAIFSTGPMRIALRSGAPVLPLFILRGEDCRHRVMIGEPIGLVSTGDTDKDVEVNTRLFLGILEDYVKRYPEHYLKLFWIDSPFFKEFKP